MKKKMIAALSMTLAVTTAASGFSVATLAADSQKESTVSESTAQSEDSSEESSSDTKESTHKSKKSSSDTEESTSKSKKSSSDTEESTHKSKKSSSDTEESTHKSKKSSSDTEEKDSTSASSSSEKPEGEAPARPEDGSGEAGEGGPAGMEKPDGSGEPGEGGPAGMGMPGGSMGGVESYDAVNTLTEDTEITGETLLSTGTDENAVLVQEGAEVSLSEVTVNRSSEDSTGGDNSSFYGVGAAILTTDGTVYVKDSEITTDAKGGAGIFAYGDNGTVYVADTEITTEKSTSGGIHAAGGGTLYAWDVTATTSGESSAAIRSDRGGGTMVVDGGTYTSNGKGSPAIYCTADITVNDAELTATGSEAICIEGLNTIRLFDCDLTGDMPENEQNDCTWNVILYQSMSGDSEIGNSTFQMSGGTLTAKNGGMFYTTNTESTFILEDVDITYAEDSDFFLKVTGNSNARGWGSTGANGAQCTFTAIDQEMEGAILWDSISTLDFYLVDGSLLTGSVQQDESNAGEGGDGYANLYLSEDSTWIVTEDSTLTGLYATGTIADEDGKSVTILGTDGTVYVEGESDLTITVKEYQPEADLSGAGEAEDWEDYEVEEPEMWQEEETNEAYGNH